MENYLHSIRFYVMIVSNLNRVWLRSFSSGAVRSFGFKDVYEVWTR